MNHGDGSYTFTNKNGETLTIDVIADVVTNIQNHGDIYNEIINILNSHTDIFEDHGDGTFTHTAADGTAITFDANTVSFIKNGEGSYTFTNENGETITIDVIADVVTNIQNHGDIYNEIVQIYGSQLKSFLTYKASSGFSLLTLSLLDGYRGANFSEDGKQFDENNDYDTTSGLFTAPQDGIYNIFVQSDFTGLLSAADQGVAIFKIDGQTNTVTLLAKEEYLSININLGITNIHVSPPTRNTTALAKLKAGDKISFGLKSPLLTLGLLRSSQTQFSIHQVK